MTQDAEDQEAQEPPFLTSVKEAEERRKSVIFIDTRNYWMYVKGHIPGDHNLKLYAFRRTARRVRV
ncbi:MAG: hypothetical protein ACRECH_13515 [Nitrososphaerales archaeon]